MLRSLVLCVVVTACSVPSLDYTELDDADASVDAVDEPGSLQLVVTPTMVVVGEAAETTFDVSLSQPPSGTVFVTLESNDDSVLDARSHLLVFEAAAWNDRQMVTVIGKSDADAFDDTGTISLSSSAVDDVVVDVTVTDDDRLKILTTPLASVEVDEGATTTVSVRLAAMPAADVIVEVASLDETIAAVAPGTLTFRADNWDAEQDVLVTGVQDDDTDSESTTLTFTSPGSPDVDDATVTAAVVDDDVLQIVPSPTNVGTLIEGGGTTFTVHLSQAINTDLDVTVMSSDTGALTVRPSTLRFTPTTWSIPQIVTMDVEQDVDDADEDVSINLATATAGVTPRTVAVSITDDDEQALIVAPTSVAVTEGATASFTVKLAYQPAAPATVSVTSLDTNVATVASSWMLLFTPSDYSDPQTVMVRGSDDQDAAPGTTSIHVEALAPALTTDVPVSVTDNDVLAIETDGASVSLSETTMATFQVRLTAAPIGSLDVTPISADVTAATVTPPKLTFTAANWNAYQMFTVTGVHDIDVAAEMVAVSLTSTSTPTATVTANVADVDVQGIQATPSSTLTVGEGMTGTIAVRLAFQPSSNVTVSATSSAPSVATVPSSMLTFTSSNYATPQTLTITGVLDPDAIDGNATITLASAAVPNSVPVAVTVTDINTLGIALERSSLSVLENATGTIRARLSAQPQSDVMVSVMSSDMSAATAMPGNLTFTSANWNVYQNVTVTGVADADASSESVTLTFASAGLSSVAASVSVTDTDVVAIVAIPGVVTATEGGTATFQVTLSQAPPSNVSVTVASADTGAATIPPAPLSFTTTNWNSPQTVTITGVQDVDLVNESVAISLTGTNLTAASVNATITDDDVQSIAVSPSNLTVTEGASGTLSVHLAYQPAGNVVVTASPGNAAIATVTPSRTFTSANYAIDQTFTVSGVEDPDAAVGTTAVTLSTPNVSPQSVTVTVNDNDPLDITTTVGALSIGEAGSGAFGVKLTAQPSANVTVNVASSDVGAATLPPAMLTFTAATWDVYQYVTVTGVDDPDAAAESVTVTCSGSGVTNRTVAVTVVDDDQLTIVTSATSVTLGENGTAMFSVHLSAQPLAATTVNVSSADMGAATVYPATLPFTTTNWANDQTVLVTGVDDVDLVNETVALTLAAPALANVSVTAAVTDNDTQQVVVTPSSLALAEGASGAVYVKLQYQPAADTTVLVTLDSAIATASAPSLTFTSANYSNVQMLTITGVQDNDGVDDSTTLSLTSTGATAASVVLTIDDDDPLAVVIASGSPASVLEGTTATFTVRLGAQPAATTMVMCTSSDTSSVTVEPSTFSVSSATYNVPTTVTITGVQDADTTNDSPVITCAATGWTPGTVPVSAWDNDTITAAGTLALYEGGTGTLRISLTDQPAGNVTVTIASTDTGTATLTGTSRMFTPTNYRTEQTVTINGVQDADLTNDSVTINVSASGYATHATAVTVHDNDTLSTEFSQITVPEGSTVPVRVRLLAQPIAGVGVAVGINDGLVATFDADVIFFDTSDWNTYKTVYVTGTVDSDAIGDMTTLNFTATWLTPAHVAVTVTEP